MEEDTSDNMCNCIIEELMNKSFNQMPQWQKEITIHSELLQPNLTITQEDKSQGYQRHFHMRMYGNVDWLCGCTNLQKLFCWPCLLFSNAATSWSSLGYDDLGNIIKAKKIHNDSAEHKSSQSKLESLRVIIKKPTQFGHPDSENVCNCIIENLLKTKFTSMPHDQKVAIFNTEILRPNLQLIQPIAAPTKCYDRHFHMRFYDSAPWMCGCEHLMKLFCWTCLLFCPTSTYWNQYGYSNLANMCRAIKVHESSKEHINASKEFKKFQTNINEDPEAEIKNTCNCIIETLVNKTFLTMSPKMQKSIVSVDIPRPNFNVVDKMQPSKRKNAFLMDLYDSTPWLCGCSYLSKLFCWPCLMFSNSLNNWGRFGFTNLDTFNASHKRHQDTLEHISSQAKYKKLLKSVRNSDEDAESESESSSDDLNNQEATEDAQDIESDSDDSDSFVKFDMQQECSSIGKDSLLDDFKSFEESQENQKEIKKSENIEECSNDLYSLGATHVKEECLGDQIHASIEFQSFAKTDFEIDDTLSLNAENISCDFDNLSNLQVKQESSNDEIDKYQSFEQVSFRPEFLNEQETIEDPLDTVSRSNYQDIFCESLIKQEYSINRLNTEPNLSEIQPDPNIDILNTESGFSDLDNFDQSDINQEYENDDIDIHMEFERFVEMKENIIAVENIQEVTMDMAPLHQPLDPLSNNSSDFNMFHGEQDSASANIQINQIPVYTEESNSEAVPMETCLVEMLVRKKFHLMSMEQKKLIIYSEAPKPIFNPIYPENMGLQKRRDLLLKLYKKNSWVCGCEHVKKLYCWPCLTFSFAANAWNKFGFNDLEHFKRTHKTHQKSKEHTNSETTLNTFLKEHRKKTNQPFHNYKNIDHVEVQNQIKYSTTISQIFQGPICKDSLITLHSFKNVTPMNAQNQIESSSTISEIVQERPNINTTLHSYRNVNLLKPNKNPENSPTISEIIQEHQKANKTLHSYRNINLLKPQRQLENSPIIGQIVLEDVDVKEVPKTKNIDQSSKTVVNILSMYDNIDQQKQSESKSSDTCNCIIETLTKNTGNGLSTEQKEALVASDIPRPHLKIAQPNSQTTTTYVRHFHPRLYESIKWLCGCSRFQKVFCWPCLIFCNNKNVWNKFGYDNLANLRKSCYKHELSILHINAQVLFKRCQNKIENIELNKKLDLPSEEYIKTVQANRYIVSKMIDVICFLSNHEQIKVNPPELLFYMSESDAQLNNHLANTKIHEDVLRDIQDELVNAIVKVILEEIRSEIVESTFVSIVVEESTSRRSYLSLFIRYLDKNLDMRERLVGFKNVSLDKNLLKFIEEKIAELDCGKKLIAQSHDGASLIDGIHKNLQKTFPSATLIQHYDHKLNLLISQSLRSVEGCGFFFQSLKSICSYFCKSTKRIAALNLQIQKRISSADQIQLQYSSKILSVIDDYKLDILNVLDEIIDHSEEWDVDTVFGAVGLKSLLKGLKFNFHLKLFVNVFNETVDLSEHLKYKPFDVNCSLQKINTLIAYLNAAKLQFHYLWEQINEDYDDEHKLKKRCLDTYQLKETYNKKYIAIIDALKNIINVRFSELGKIKFVALLDVKLFDKHQTTFPDDLFQYLDFIYPEIFDLAKLKAELEYVYSCQNYQTLKTTVELIKSLADIKEVLPELWKFIEFVYTMPIMRPDDKKRTSYNSALEKDPSLAILSYEKSLLENLKGTKVFHDKVIEEFSKKDHLLHLN